MMAMNALSPLGRVGSRNMYLGPDGRTGMRFREAKAAQAAGLRAVPAVAAE